MSQVGGGASSERWACPGMYTVVGHAGLGPRSTCSCAVCRPPPLRPRVPAGPVPGGVVLAAVTAQSTGTVVLALFSQKQFRRYFSGRKPAAVEKTCRPRLLPAHPPSSRFRSSQGGRRAAGADGEPGSAQWTRRCNQGRERSCKHPSPESSLLIKSGKVNVKTKVYWRRGMLHGDERLPR